MSRGLAGEVPGLKWCKKMAGVPALAEAFKESTLFYGQWDMALWTDSSEPRIYGHELQKVELCLGCTAERFLDDGKPCAIGKKNCTVYRNVYAAPTVRELRAYLFVHHDKGRERDGWIHLNDPDDLTRWLTSAQKRMEDAR